MSVLSNTASSHKMPSIKLSAKVPSTFAGQRFDQIASELFPDYSRSRLQSWIKEGKLRVDGLKKKPNAKLSGAEMLVLEADLEVSEEWVPEAIPFEVVFEDDDLIVIDKPQPLVVHPAAGNWRGTLLNGLIYRYPELMQLPRAGIVHRLDKETSGLMVVARSIPAQLSLVEQLQARTVSRTYWAAVKALSGAPEISKRGGQVNAPLGRHPSQRTKMAVVKQGGKEALTHYRPLRSSDDHHLLELKLETGRTHQIRVHMAHIGMPLVGDPVYGQQYSSGSFKFGRQALHAKRLGLKHPSSHAAMQWESDLPSDMRALLEHLELIL